MIVPRAAVWDDAGEPLPGTVSEQLIKCGKPGCRCRTGRLHGPYFYRVWRGQGRTVHRVYVKAAEVEQVRARCARHRALADELHAIAHEVRALAALATALTARLRVQVARSRRLRAALALACSGGLPRWRKPGEGFDHEGIDRMTHYKPNPEFDDVYAAVANAYRQAGDRSGPAGSRRMTKARVAAVHRKMVAGEPLDAGPEQDLAGRLRRQLGPGPRWGDGSDRRRHGGRHGGRRV